MGPKPPKLKKTNGSTTPATAPEPPKTETHVQDVIMGLHKALAERLHELGVHTANYESKKDELMVVIRQHHDEINVLRARVAQVEASKAPAAPGPA